MANEAHKEPTMEEILASIRKIISDDSSSPASGARPDPIPEPEIANDDDDDEVVSLEEVMFDEEAREEAFEELAELEVEDFVDDEIGEEEITLEEEPVPVAEDASESFESLLSASRAARAMVVVGLNWFTTTKMRSSR